MALEDKIFDERAGIKPERKRYASKAGFGKEVEVTVHLNDKEVLEQLDQLIEQKLKEACVMVQDEAKQRCPVDTGRLQGSITYQLKDRDDGSNEGIVGTNVEYAPYVEAGTKKMKGTHFLQIAGELNRQKIKALFRELV